MSSKISLENYIKKKEINDYVKCPKCKKNKMKLESEMCSKCKFKECMIEGCNKFLKKDSKYDICYDCNKKIKDILENS